jgi:glycosyltransferase involved in cell wall biosynthesis
MKVSFIMPALNEEEGIVKVLKEIPLKELRKKKFDVEVIVVDGGSIDRTVELARKYGAKVIISERGYGRQYRKGFSIATGDIVVTGDSDGSYPFRDSTRFVDLLIKEELDFINTNRFAKFEKGSISLSHLFGNVILTLTTRILFNINIKDSQSGMWIFRRKILDKMNLVGEGMPLSEEIKIEAFKKFKCKEIPIFYRKRLGKVKISTIKDGLDNFFFLFYKRLIFR